MLSHVIAQNRAALRTIEPALEGPVADQAQRIEGAEPNVVVRDSDQRSRAIEITRLRTEGPPVWELVEKRIARLKTVNVAPNTSVKLVGA